MAKGIIYCMTTIVPGLIKIGKTGSNNFDQRMYILEHNGYANVVGLKRYFAIEVEDYDEKETLLDDIFSKSKVDNTELFALDIDLVVQLLSSFDGKQIYPEDKSKEDIFIEATDKRNTDCIPDGEYYFAYTPRNGRTYNATLRKEQGLLYLKKGSELYIDRDELVSSSWSLIRHSDSVENGVVIKDIICDSVSMAGSLVKGNQANGWIVWKDKNGNPIDKYRA